jgi:UDP-N-acetylmuramate--alanine ligase
MNDLQQSQTAGMASRIRRIHLIGIGGAGMGGIAEVLHNLGFDVTGSDMANGAMTQRLKDMGIPVTLGHKAENIRRCEVVVTSTAVHPDNPEVQAAREQRIPIVPRAEMLAELMRFSHGIAVAGTHGKTTTTSLVASLLAEGDLDPTFVIGGLLNSAGTNAKLGTSHYLVAEADESDASFLYLQPMMAIVTNIDKDHMSTYDGDWRKLKNAFAEFLHHLPFYGQAVLCLDDPGVQEVLSEISRPITTYGITSHNLDFQATDIQQVATCTEFQVLKSDVPWLQVTLNLPGTHNVLNALAAIAIADELGISKQAIQRGLKKFQGIARRFQIGGDIEINQQRALFVDDYAHHPRELQATFDAIRAGWPDKRLVVIFQPHRYSRTHDLMDDFVQALSMTDVLLLLEVYTAGEDPIPGADSRGLAQAIRARGKLNPIFVDTAEAVDAVLSDVLQNNDLLLTVGAGSVGTLSRRLLESYGIS